MVFSLGGGDQFGNVVVAETTAQSHRSWLRAIRFRGGGRKNLIQAHTQRGVDHFLERFAQFGGASLCFGRNVGIKRQSGSHTGIMMLTVRKSTHGSEQILHFRLHRGTHIDDQRPRSFRSCARQSLRRINARFAAARDLAGGTDREQGGHTANPGETPSAAVPRRNRRRVADKSDLSFVPHYSLPAPGFFLVAGSCSGFDES